jgi:hypothetical protein
VYADGFDIGARDESVIKLMAWVAVPEDRRVAAGLVSTHWKARTLVVKLRKAFGP